MRAQRDELEGKRFGMLTVLSYAGTKDGFHMWKCRCDCGKETLVRQSNLKGGRTKSCGCKTSPDKTLHFVEGTCVEKIRSRKISRANTSGVKGVYYNKKRGKWVAQIMFRGKCYNLGGYEKLEDAAKARARGEEKIFGDFLEWYDTQKNLPQQIR